jgi:hypothetical protein
VFILRLFHALVVVRNCSCCLCYLSLFAVRRQDKPEPFAFEPLRGEYWHPDQPYTRDSLVGWRGPAYLKSDLVSGKMPNFYVPTSFYGDIRERILNRAEKWARRARAAGPRPRSPPVVWE